MEYTRGEKRELYQIKDERKTMRVDNVRRRKERERNVGKGNESNKL